MKIFILLICFSVLSLSCTKERLTASGDKTTETRTLKNFKGVRVSTANDIHITYGPEYKVELRGSNNLIPYFKTTITGSTLYLGYEQVNVRHDDIEVYVTLPLIDHISLSGSGSIQLGGQFPYLDFLELAISGSGEIEVENAIAAAETAVKISGSGDADLEKLAAKNAEVNISGSGDVKLNVLDGLKARISGSGMIYYSGNPQIDSRISGSGKVIKL